MGKRRSLDADQSAVFAEIQEDLNQTEVHKAYLGTIATDVRVLDTNAYENREIDRDHVAALIEGFGRGCRRYFKETRMKATMSSFDYEAYLQHYVDGQGEGSVHQARVRATNTDGGTLADFVHLKEWPADLPTPSLIAGQHRRAALVSLVDEQSKLASSGAKRADGQPLEPPEPEAYFWAIDVYDANKTKGNILTSLQGNTDDPYKVDRDGYNLLRMLHDPNTMADQEQKETLKGSNFEPWAQSNFGIKGTQTDRIVS
ncbi:hypothetical protein IFM46972_09442 [Aspergillus udagawae]|uniref:Uncharacterized protein n=1 Tax=Aspergillus udagawae TaxID=91492 RepID=A0A8H3XKN6_9EURO|nr:hypothetical protein IFM46972_09442 [Aspergillus udagawae]